MNTVLRASLRTHTRRYVSAAVAVVIGVTFIVVTSLLSSAAREGLVAGVAQAYRGADVVVTDVDARQAERLIERADREGAAVSLMAWTPQEVRADGRLIEDRARVGSISEEPGLRWQELREGRYPERAGEVVADLNALKGRDVELGDPIEVGSFTGTLVGLVDTPSAAAGSDLYLRWDDLLTVDDAPWIDSVSWAGAGAAELLQDPPVGTVQPRDQFVQELQAELTNEVDVLAILLLVFAAVALVVSVLVIANTFSILFAQRARDVALLRCIGATQRQVLRSVRVEALLLGAASALLGLVVGTALGYALVGLAAGALPAGSMGTPTPSLPWYAGAFAVGVLVTAVAAWLPTRRVVRVSPLAALRPDDSTSVRTGAGRVRVLLGLAAVGLGTVLLALSITASSPLAMVLGGTAAFGGVLLLGPVLVPALIRAVGGAAGRVAGAPARLAAENAVRNPRRTAATTASLLVGVTLTTAVLVGLASSRSAVDEDLDRDYPVDLALTADDGALPAGLLDEVRAVPGVDDAVALDGVVARIGKRDVPVVAPTGADAVTRGAPALASPRKGQVWLPSELAHRGHMVVQVGDQRVRLSVNSGDGWGDAAIVSPATLAALADRTAPQAIWVRAADGADAEDLAGDLDALAQGGGATLHNGLRERHWVTLQLDILTGTVVALLGIAVVIALVGIGNTLGLSVLERRRENALLRALGLTRRQLRATLAAEALLLSVVATVLGTLIGVTFAWVSLQALVEAAVDRAPLVLPWGQLAAVVLVAAVAGVLSSLLPARAAARTAPAAGLSLD